MSSRFTLHCNDHDVDGPHIRRHHQTGVLMASESPRFFPDDEPDQAAKDWGAFLIEHEWCELVLRR